MKKFSILAIIFFSILSINTIYATEKGEKAPDIQVIKWINSQPTLLGKPILLEFWATWCGPCKKAIPHINELVDKYGKDINVVSISSEQDDQVTKFMKNNPMKAFVGIDFEKKTSLAYKIRFIPHSYLINADGTIEWVGSPFELKDEQINAFIEKNKTIKSKESIIKTVNPKDLKFSLKITKSTDDNSPGTISDSPDGLVFSNMKIDALYEILLESSPEKVEVQSDLLNEKYNISYKHELTQPFNEYRIKLLERISKELKVNVKKEEVSANAYIIQCADCSILQKQFDKLKESTNTLQSSFTEKDGKMVAKVINIHTLIRYLETIHKKIFIDETKLNGFYNFTISQANISEAIKDLESAGLRIISQENAKISLYTVEKKK